MPLYEYRCQTCGHVDEHLMKLSDPPPEGCTQCSGPVSKLLSQTSFALKGEGWYVTDYKPKPAGAAADAPPAAEAAGGATPAPATPATPSAGADSSANSAGNAPSPTPATTGANPSAPSTVTKAKAAP